jgi:hypothetical protein
MFCFVCCRVADDSDMVSLMAAKYEYTGKGVLSQQMCDWVRSGLQGHPFMVEIDQSKLPPYEEVQLWERGAIAPAQGTGEDCMGQKYVKTYRPGWFCGRPETGTMFRGFAQEGERAAFILAFPDCIVNADPFKVIF